MSVRGEPATWVFCCFCLPIMKQTSYWGVDWLTVCAFYMADTVTNGPYWGFTTTEIALEVEKYKLARKTASDHIAASGGGRVASGNIGGEQVSYTYPEGIESLEEWAIVLKDAQSQLNDEESTAKRDAVYGFSTIS